MKRILFAATAVLLFATYVPASAQEYAVEITNDKKIIHVKNFDLPDNSSLEELLMMLPEFTNRDGDEMLAGYDVRLDGKSVAELRDVILSKTLLYEVEKIEISTSPTASQQRNGTAGVINIVPAALSSGISGSASLVASTSWNLMPDVSLNYKGDKLEVRGNFGLEYSAPTTSSLFEKTTAMETLTGADTTSLKYLQETARLQLKYTPSKKDVLKMWLWESWDRESSEMRGIQSIAGMRPDLSHLANSGSTLYDYREQPLSSSSMNEDFNFTAIAQYEHSFIDDFKVVLSADYVLNNQKVRNAPASDLTVSKPQSVKGEAKFVVPFFRKEENYLKLECGANVDYNRQSDKNYSLFSSPFAELQFKTKDVSLKAGIRHQFQRRTVEAYGQTDFIKADDDYTCNLNAFWQIVPHHALRLMAVRNIIRPSIDKYFPELTWDAQRSMYLKGNNSLASTLVRSLDCCYIFDRRGAQSYLVTNFGFGYDRVDGLVEEYTVFDEDLSLFYNTYRNSGINDIFNVKGNFIYQYDVFSLSLAANFYHNNMKLSSGHDKYNYFNISLSPVVKLKKDWSLSAQALYNSKVHRASSTLGDCLCVSVVLNKNVGRWSFRAALRDVFDYQTDDFEDNGIYVMRSSYDLYTRCLTLGLSYRIGK